MQVFSAIDGQSLFDVCLNTYGSLDFMYKLLQDNAVASVKDEVATGQAFSWDDSQVINQQVNQAYAASGIFYSTSISSAEQTSESIIITEDGIEITDENGNIIITE